MPDLVCVCGHLACVHIPRDGRCTGASCDCRAITEHAAGEASLPDNPHDAAPEFPPALAAHGSDKPAGNSTALDDPLAQRIREAIYDEASIWEESFEGGPGLVVGVADAAVVAARFMRAAGDATPGYAAGIPIEPATDAQNPPDDEDAVRAVHDDCDPDWCASEGHQVCGYAVLIAALDAARAEVERLRKSNEHLREIGHHTSYSRYALSHDMGEHAGSENPYWLCPRCEMEHPRGRLAQMKAQRDAARDLAAHLEAENAAIRALCDEADRSELRAVPKHLIRAVLDRATSGGE